MQDEERKLRQISERYRAFFDGVRVYAFYTVDRAGCVTGWDTGAERLFGYSEAEIMGRSSSCFIGPENIHREMLRQAMLEADRSGWAAREGWRIRKDGTRFLGAGVLSTMGNGYDREYGILTRDVTWQRPPAEDSQQIRKTESIEVFAAGIAHNFNNLLTGIMGSMSFMKTMLHSNDPLYPLVEIAEQSTAQAAELVAQILAYSGNGMVTATRFDLSALIREMRPLIAASVPKDIELEFLLPTELPWIEGDAGQIRQVVMSLITNSVEAIGPKEGKVRISTNPSCSGTEVFVEVKDTGAGMSETTQARMFDPFFTTHFMGRGLGLAVVSGIVRKHRGKMHVDSIAGQGTSFTVFFPAVPAGVPSLAVGQYDGK